MSLSTGSHPAGSWHPGMGSRPADHGYAGPGGTYEGIRPRVISPEAGHSVKRGDIQSADPTIKDKRNRRNVQGHAERTGPIGHVQTTRSVSEHAETGRMVRLMAPVYRSS